MKITLPYNLNINSSLEFQNSINKFNYDGEVTFDFLNCRGIIEPSGMLLAATTIRSFCKRKPDIKINFSNYMHMSYPAHMGFFHFFGVDYGKKPGQALGSNKYNPLTIISTAEIKKQAIINSTEVGDEVESFCKKLTSNLCNEQDKNLFDTLVYSMRELMRNVIEHSQADELIFCSQYWPSKNLAEVCIIDEGAGIKSTLANNPHIDAGTDKKSLNYALMPAISGKAFKGAPKPRQKSHWNNSGFGLYMTSRICRNGGSFFIASGDTGLLLTSGKEGKKYFSTNHKGTLIRMRINTNDIPSIKNALETYRREGQEIQRQYQEIVNIDPSSASLMLSEDFEPGLMKILLHKLLKVPTI